MAVTPPAYLLLPIYLPLCKSYGSDQAIIFTGNQARMLVHDLELLNAGAGTGENIEQTLIIGDDANGQDLLNVDNFTCNYITNSASPGGQPLHIDDFGGGGAVVTIYPAGPLLLKSGSGGVTLDSELSALTILHASDIDASAITGSLIVGGVGVKTAAITELTGGGGVAILGTVKTNRINQRNTNLTIETTVTGLALTLNTLDTDLTLNSGANLVLATAGIVTMNGADTYTGTVAGAAAKNVVNGLIMN